MPRFGNKNPLGGTNPLGGIDTSGSQKDVVVTVNDAGMKNLGAVADRLRTKGLTVQQTFAPVGTIIGKADPDKLAILQDDPDVVTVNVSRNYDTAGG